MAESVGEVLGGFEGEPCGFPSFEGVVRLVWLGFFGGGMLRLAAEACDTWERLQVQREHHCLGVGGE